MAYKRLTKWSKQTKDWDFADGVTDSVDEYYEKIGMRLCELEDKIEQGTLIAFPRITETVYGLEWTVEYVSNLRTGTGIAKVFCGTKEQAEAVLKIVKKYGYPKEDEIKKLQEVE